MYVCMCSGLLPQLPESIADHHKGGDSYQKVSDRSGVEDAVDPEEAGQGQQEDDQDQLLGQGDDDAVYRLLDRDHGVHGHGQDAGQDDQQHVGVHIAQGEGLIAARAASEEGQDLAGEEPEAGGLHRSNEKGVR